MSESKMYTKEAASPRRLAAIIVSFNRRQELKKGVAALLAEPICGVVVVDNGSTDGSREWLASQSDDRLRVLCPERNLGGAGGFEIGFGKALEAFSPDWLVCLDDDARPAPGALVRFLKQDLRGIDGVAAAVYYPDGRICEMNRPSWNPFWHGKFLIRTLLGALCGRSRQGFHVQDHCYRDDGALDIDSSSFVGCFVRAEKVRSIGLPRGELFIYGDDIIYTLSLRKTGARHVFLPKIRFIHDCKVELHAAKSITPLWKAYYTYRNGLVMYRIAAGPWFALVLPVKALYWLSAVRHYADKRRYLNLWWLAITDGIRGKTDRLHEDIVRLYD